VARDIERKGKPRIEAVIKACRLPMRPDELAVVPGDHAFFTAKEGGCLLTK
jgi:hypothetical protein